MYFPCLLIYPAIISYDSIKNNFLHISRSGRLGLTLIEGSWSGNNFSANRCVTGPTLIFRKDSPGNLFCCNSRYATFIVPLSHLIAYVVVLSIFSTRPDFGLCPVILLSVAYLCIGMRLRHCRPPPASRAVVQAN